MIQYFVHEKMLLDAAKAYQTIFDVIHKADEEMAKDLNTDGRLKSRSF